MLIQRSITDCEGRPNIEAGKWALPGGFVQPNESAMQSAKRELMEETGIKGIHLEHYGVYDTPGRDPRGWIITNAHYAIVPDHKLSKRQANDDASDVQLFSVNEVLNLDLAFDHAQMIKDAMDVIRQKLLETTVAKEFLPEEFTYSELQAVLLTVTDDSAITVESSFARKIKTLPFIQEVEGKKTTEDENGSMVDTIKISANPEKISTPERKRIFRIMNTTNGKSEGDYIALEHEEPQNEERLHMFHPVHTYIAKFVATFEARELHHSIFENGNLVYKIPTLQEVRKFVQENLDVLWEEYKRTLNPAEYPC